MTGIRGSNTTSLTRTWLAPTATCGSARAGAIVPVGAGIGGAGFLRERIKYFPRPATKAEIDAALKALRGPAN